MKYTDFFSEITRLPASPTPDVWARIEHSISRPTIIAFPRVRLMLVAAVFAFLFVFPTSLFVSTNHQQQVMYAYLQNTGSSEYVTLASINY